MYRLFLAGLDAAVASILIIPVFLLLNRVSFHSRKKTLLYTVLSVYLAGVYLVVGLPNVTYFRFEPNINLIPFLDLFSDISATILNIVLFLPLGFLSALLWKSFRTGKNACILGLSVSLSIELLQMFTFRATDVNDLMTNVLGCMMGWYISSLILKHCPRLACNGTPRDGRMVLGTVLGIMFFIHPFLAPHIWNLLY